MSSDQNTHAAVAALLQEMEVSLTEVETNELYVNSTYIDKETGEVIETIILL